MKPYMLWSFILLSCLLTATFQDEIEGDSNAETVAKQADVLKNDEEPVASNAGAESVVGGSSGDKTNEAKVIQEATEMLEKQNEMGKPAEAAAPKESSAVEDTPIQPFDEPSVVDSEPKAEAVKEAPKEVRFSLLFYFNLNHIKLKYL